jgi:hypothetical protein
MLAALPLGVLSTDEEATVREHSAACAECRALLERVEEALASGKTTPRAMPGGSWERLQARFADGPPRGADLRIAVGCTFCHDFVEKPDAVFCASCLAPHHDECFVEHGRCSAPGCSETRTVKPRERTRLERRPAERQGRKGVILVLAAALLGAGAAAALKPGASRTPATTVAPDAAPSPEQRAADALAAIQGSWDGGDEWGVVTVSGDRATYGGGDLKILIELPGRNVVFDFRGPANRAGKRRAAAFRASPEGNVLAGTSQADDGQWHPSRWVKLAETLDLVAKLEGVWEGWGGEIRFHGQTATYGRGKGVLSFARVEDRAIDGRFRAPEGGSGSFKARLSADDRTLAVEFKYDGSIVQHTTWRRPAASRAVTERIAEQERAARPPGTSVTAVERAYLGVTLEPEGPGARIAEVLPGAPPTQPTLERGDVIEFVDARPIADPRALRAVLMAAATDQALTLGVQKGGRRWAIALRAPAGATRHAFLGADVADPWENGIQVVSVLAGSPADEAEIRVDDRLLEIEGVHLATLDVFTRELAKRGPGERVRIRLSRRGSTSEKVVALGAVVGE